jgi:hypothetical protein
MMFSELVKKQSVSKYFTSFTEWTNLL